MDNSHLVCILTIDSQSSKLDSNHYVLFANPVTYPAMSGLAVWAYLIIPLDT